MQIHESVEIEGEHHTGFVRGGILLRLLVENRFSDMRAFFARLKQTLHDQNDVGRIQRQTADQLGLCFFHGNAMMVIFSYPLVNIQKTMENGDLMGKLTISMAIFNSFLLVYHRVTSIKPETSENTLW